jgi:hypothetical protein
MLLGCVNRCNSTLTPWILILWTFSVASAQQSSPPTSERLDAPVIRASELPLKETTTVAAVKGVVRITRNSHILNPSVGDSVKPGDLVQIAPNSSLTLKSTRGVVTLTSNEGEWFKFVP